MTRKFLSEDFALHSPACSKSLSNNPRLNSSSIIPLLRYFLLTLVSVNSQVASLQLSSVIFESEETKLETKYLQKYLS